MNFSGEEPFPVINVDSTVEGEVCVRERGSELAACK